MERGASFGTREEGASSEGREGEGRSATSMVVCNALGWSGRREECAGELESEKESREEGMLWATKGMGPELWVNEGRVELDLREA